MRSINMLAILGPTATGKTRLGVQAAHALGSEIISADSRQVYRGLDLGTGKDLHEYAAVDPPVAVHLIDVADPDQVFTLFDYQQRVFEVLRELSPRSPFASGAPVLLVGGTGLYAESVLRQYRLADVPQDLALRRELANQDQEVLWERLKRTAPEIAAQTDPSSHRRVVRGMEIAAAAKRGVAAWGRPLELEMQSRVAVVSAHPDDIRRRVRDRLEARLRDGMVEEVRSLLREGLSPQRLRQLGLEYREVGAYLGGRCTRTEMIERLATRIGQFAKRQLTWFRGMERRGLEVRWIDPGDVVQVLNLAAEFN